LRIGPNFEVATESEELDYKEKLKTKWAALEAVVGVEKRLFVCSPLPIPNLRQIVAVFINVFLVLDEFSCSMNAFSPPCHHSPNRRMNQVFTNCVSSA
jgi:hypothetical protein